MDHKVTRGYLHDALKAALEEQTEKLIQELKPTQPEEYLKRAEVAEMLKVHPSSILNYRRQGILKAYTIGSGVLYKRSEVEEAIKEAKDIK